MDPTKARRLIPVAIFLSAAGAMYRDAALNKNAPRLGPHKLPIAVVSLAGVFVVGFAALALSESYPDMGASMGGLLLFDVALSIRQAGSGPNNQNGLYDTLGRALFRAAPAPGAPAAPTAASPLPPGKLA